MIVEYTRSHLSLIVMFAFKLALSIVALSTNRYHLVLAGTNIGDN